MARSVFAERFGYVIWLAHLRTGTAPSFAEIGRAIGGLTGQAVSGWADREKPPANYELHKPLATFFGVSIDWLIGGEGEAPQKELWEIWLRERRPRSGKLSEGGIPAARPGADKRKQA